MLCKINFICDICEKSYNYEFYLNHKANCKPKQYIKCPICDNDGVDSTLIDQHNLKIEQNALKLI